MMPKLLLAPTPQHVRGPSGSFWLVSRTCRQMLSHRNCRVDAPSESTQLTISVPLRNTGVTLNAPLVWGHDHIGVGTLLALRAGRAIIFEDRPSKELYVPPKSNHLVVSEQGDELSQVIAANYAHALGAGLFLIRDTAT